MASKVKPRTASRKRAGPKNIRPKIVRATRATKPVRTSGVRSAPRTPKTPTQPARPIRNAGGSPYLTRWAYLARLLGIG